MKRMVRKFAHFPAANALRIRVRAAGKTKSTSKKGSLLRAKALRRRQEEASPKLTLNPNLLNQ